MMMHPPTDSSCICALGRNMMMPHTPTDSSYLHRRRKYNDVAFSRCRQLMFTTTRHQINSRLVCTHNWGILPIPKFQYLSELVLDKKCIHHSACYSGIAPLVSESTSHDLCQDPLGSIMPPSLTSQPVTYVLPATLPCVLFAFHSASVRIWVLYRMHRCTISSTPLR